MASIFNKITNLSFLKSDDGILGIDIGSSAIKIVQIQKQGGKAVLKNYGSLALGQYSELSIGQAVNLSKNKIVEALSDLIRESGVDTKNSAMAIPLKDTMISFIKMPNFAQKQLEQMVPIEARRHIPVPMSEVTLDFWVIPKNETAVPVVPSSGKVDDKKVDNKIDVLVAAIHNSALSKYQDIQKMSGLNVELFEIELFSTIRSTLGSVMDPVMIIDIGAAITKLAMVDCGVLQSSHLINKGSQDITIALSKSLGIDIEQAEEIKRNPSILTNDVERKQFSDVVSLPLSYIFSEVNSVLLDYQNKHNKIVKKVIFSGGGSLLEGLIELAKENFNIEVALCDPFARFEAPAFVRGTLKKIGPEFSVAVGLAIEAL